MSAPAPTVEQEVGRLLFHVAAAEHALECSEDSLLRAALLVLREDITRIADQTATPKK